MMYYPILLQSWVFLWYPNLSRDPSYTEIEESIRKKYSFYYPYFFTNIVATLFWTFGTKKTSKKESKFCSVAIKTSCYTFLLNNPLFQGVTLVVRNDQLLQLLNVKLSKFYSLQNNVAVFQKFINWIMLRIIKDFQIKFLYCNNVKGSLFKDHKLKFACCWLSS